MNETTNENDSILRILLQGLITSLVTGLLIYYLTKVDSQINWCNNEIKNFDVKNYKSKDLSILSKICKDELLEYDLFSNLIYDNDNNETKRFGKTINKLLIDNKINKNLIDDISMFKLVNILSNKRFEYVSSHSNKKNDLFSVNKYIEKFLIFSNEIDFEKYNQAQLDSLIGIFSQIFGNEKLLRSTHIPRFNPPFPYSEDYFSENPIQLDNFKLFRKLMNKIDKNNVNIEEYIYTHTQFDQNSTNYKIQLLFNSYIFSNKKEELIQEVINLFNIIRNKELHLTSDGEKLLTLILLELGDNYSLTKEELHSIYDSYSYFGKTNIMYLLYDRELIDQLVYNLKSDRFIPNDDIYTQYFINKIKSNKFTFESNNEDFIWFLSNKGNKKLLIELFNVYKNNNLIQDNIFRAILLSSMDNRMYYGTIHPKDILKVLKDTKDINKKSKYIKYSLYTKDYELVLNAINYINSSKSFYVKQLDKVDHYDIVYHHFFLGSIFSALGEAIPSYVGKQKEIRNKKIELFIDYIQLTKSKESKFELFKLLVNMLKHDSFTLPNKIKSLIDKEDNSELKFKYVNYFKDKLNYLKQKEKV